MGDAWHNSLLKSPFITECGLTSEIEALFLPRRVAAVLSGYRNSLLTWWQRD